VAIDGESTDIKNDDRPIKDVSMGCYHCGTQKLPGGIDLKQKCTITFKGDESVKETTVKVEFLDGLSGATMSVGLCKDCMVKAFEALARNLINMPDGSITSDYIFYL
jgi:hypothetical protein